MKKLFIFSLVTLILASSFGILSAAALDGEYNCPVYVYDSSTQSFFGYGYLYLEGDTTDSIFRLHGYNERDITLDFSAPNEAGTDYYLYELQLNAVNGPGLYGINFVDGPDANSMSTLPVIPMYNVSYSDGIFWSQRYDWSGYSDGFAIVLYFNGFEPAEAYDPPYTPGEIQSGVEDVQSGLAGIDSELSIESITPDQLDHFLGTHIKIDPEVNAIAPLSNFLNTPLIVTLLLSVFSFATISFILFGKKA